tara:strand:- start:165 stop:473 length:309 start_codon:yes stop_codon:yes gene_type:complete
MTDYYGGMFWDVLLLAEYKGWDDFYLSMTNVIPCDKCRKDGMLWLNKNKIPDFKSNDEKNEWLWRHRLQRGGAPWRKKVEENGYTLESWIGLYMFKKFTANN